MRGAWIGIILLGLVVGLPSVAAADPTTADQAERLNDEGKALYQKNDFAGAATKFEEAIAQNPDARFYFNLCATREKLGQLDAALEACDQVYAYSPDDSLKGKTGQRAASIRAKLKDQPAPAQPTPVDPATPVDPNQPATPVTPPPTTYPPEPEPIPTVGEYRWSVGGDIGVAANGNLGERIQKSGVAVKLHLDWMLAPKLGIGLRTHLDFLNLVGGGRDSDSGLSIVNLGAGIFKNFNFGSGLFVAPLAGVYVGTLTPEEATYAEDYFFGLGFKAEVTAGWAFGPQGRNVFYVTPFSYNFFLPAAADSSALSAASYGLDESGGVWAVTVGYERRFTSIIPGFVTLE